MNASRHAGDKAKTKLNRTAKVLVIAATCPMWRAWKTSFSEENEWFECTYGRREEGSSFWWRPFPVHPRQLARRKRNEYLAPLLLLAAISLSIRRSVGEKEKR